MLILGLVRIVAGELWFTPIFYVIVAHTDALGLRLLVVYLFRHGMSVIIDRLSLSSAYLPVWASVSILALFLIVFIGHFPVFLIVFMAMTHHLDWRCFIFSISFYRG